MAAENVEIIRRGIDAFNRRDLDELLQGYDPDAEVDLSRSPGLQAGIYRGREAVRAFWNTFFEAWERMTVSVDEYIDCGESVVVPTRTRFWGREGIEVEAYGVFVVILRDARIVVWRLFRQLDEALNTARLEQ